MAETGTINQTSLLRINRFDAEYFRRQNAHAFDLVSAHQTMRIGALAFITDGEHGTLQTSSDGFAKYYGARNVLTGILTNKGVEFITKEAHERLLKSVLAPDDVLISCVGANIGSAAIVPDDVGVANIVRNVALVRSKSEAVNNQYLLAYFMSKYGRQLFVRVATGNAQPLVSLDNIKTIPVPIFSQPFQRRIREWISEAKLKHRRSLELYLSAQQLLLSELGLADWRPLRVNTFERSYKDSIMSRRIDAEHFHPKYDDITATIDRHSPRKLINLANPCQEMIRIDPENDYRYIEIGDVDVTTGEVGFTERQGKDLPANAKIKIKGGELVISKVRPTRGAVGVVPVECSSNSVCSGAFSVFEVSSPMREYLQIVLRTEVGKLQMEKQSRGTSYPTIDNIDVNNVSIPMVQEAVITNIADLVVQSRIRRQESVTLLQNAKRKVEQAIEGGKESAS